MSLKAAKFPPRPTHLSRRAMNIPPLSDYFINTHVSSGKVSSKYSAALNDKLIIKNLSKKNTTWKIIKKEIGSNCQNDIKYLKINNNILNNPQEIANTFNDYFATVAHTVIGNIIKGYNDSKDNMNTSSYLITNFHNTYSSINWTSKFIRLSNH
jgi:hypothetical protein